MGSMRGNETRRSLREGTKNAPKAKAFGARGGCDQFGSLFFLGIADDAVLGSGDELRDIVNFRRKRDLFFDFDFGIFEREVAGCDHMEGIGDVAQEAFVRFGAHSGNDFGVHAVIGRGVAAENAVGDDVALDAAATLQENEFANTHTTLHNGGGGKDGIVIDETSTRNAGRNTEHTVVADADVVGNVHLVHEVIVVPDARGVLGAVASRDEYVLADDVVVTDNDVRFLSFLEVEGLGFGTNDGVLVDDVASSDGGSVENGDVGHDDAIVADADVAFDVDEGTNFDVLTNLRGRINVSKRADHRANESCEG